MQGRIARGFTCGQEAALQAPRMRHVAAMPPGSFPSWRAGSQSCAWRTDAVDDLTATARIVAGPATLNMIILM